MTSIVAAAGGGNWTTGATWVGGIAPTAADDAVINGTSGNVTIDAGGALCRSLDCTGYTGILNHLAAATLTIGDATRGDFKLSSGGTYTRGSSSTSILAFVSTASGNLITFNGKTVSPMTFNGVGGTWTFQDSCSTNAQTTLTAGTLDLGTGLTHNMFQLNSTNANVRTLNLHNCIINLAAAFNGSFDLTITTNLTFNAGTSSIIMSGAGPVTQLMRTGGVTFYDFSITGTGVIGIIGNNTFHNLTRSNAAACGLTLPNGGTQTITNALQLSGTSGNVVTITSVTAGTASSISMGAGIVSQDWLSLKDSTATGGGTFYAGANSTNVSGNTGWIFSAPPGGAVLNRMGLLGVGN